MKQLTTEEFIAKAKTVHGDKYDYSKVKYNGAKTKVCIICPEHGEFWQMPYAHLNGQRCPKCYGSPKPNKEEFIQKAKEVHGDKYDYSKVEYVNSRTKICIICPEHGEFWQTPSSHLQGTSCPKCQRKSQTKTLQNFIEQAKAIHGDKYDYSKVEYVNTESPICIICPEHGEFWQTPHSHLAGAGCPKCWGRNKNNVDFIKEAQAIHGNKYDYSKVNYINSSTKICIICPEHGEFWVTPNNHLRGHGCPNCYKIRTAYKFNLLQEFKDEYAFRAFLENNDSFILYNILMNIEPKYEPIKKDIEKVLLNSSESDPIQALEDKYKSDEEDEVETEVKIESMFSDIDWDDDDAVNNAIESVSKEDDKEISIEDIIKNREQEIEVINRIEHMLTPEVREYIIEKFNNDRWRMLMAEKDK